MTGIARPTGTTRPSGTTRPRGVALTVLCAATLMIILDGTIVTVALPSIQRDLHVPAATLTWVLNAYLIAFGGLLLLAGQVGDLIGRKRVFLAGLATFTAASLACGLAGSPQLLIAARLVQGAGGAMVTAVSLGMITTLYPEPPDRARAVAAYSFTGPAGRRSAWSSAACSPRPSAGTGSSSSTSRSACWPGCRLSICSPRSAVAACGPAPTGWAPHWSPPG